MLIVEINSVAELAEWTDRCDVLARSCGGRFFQSMSWLQAWARVLELRSRLILLVDGDGAAPEGLLALSHLRRRVHHRLPVNIKYIGLAGAGLGAADHLGPLARSDASARRLLEAAAEYAGPHPLVLENLAQRHVPLAASLRGAVEISRRACPVLDLGSVTSTDQIWSPKLRADLRRRDRRLTDAGLSRRWVHGEADGVDALRQLQRLHLARWQSRGAPGLFDQQRMDFLSELLPRSNGADGVWIQLIEGADGPVAALLGFEYAGAFCSYKTGWDPSARHLGLGIMLHSAAIQRAVERNLQRYDFLRGAEAHKFKLGGVAETNATYAVPHGAAGRLLVGRDRLAGRIGS